MTPVTRDAKGNLGLNISLEAQQGQVGMSCGRSDKFDMSFPVQSPPGTKHI
jgi:hypothetical protein